MKMTIEISATSMAEKTDEPADPDVKSTTTNDEGVTFVEPCGTDGQVRQTTVDGICYVQMCCGGQWLFWYKDVGNTRVWCTCTLGETWNVNCAGNTWMIGCR